MKSTHLMTDLFANVNLWHQETALYILSFELRVLFFCATYLNDLKLRIAISVWLIRR